MLEVAEIEIKKRMALDNPWWDRGGADVAFEAMRPRAYLDGFHALVTDRRFHRAAVLMGPRRVGKTVMIHHLIARLIKNDGVPPKHIMYVSLDTPHYTSTPPEKLLEWFFDLHGHTRSTELFIMFDEIQYRKDWERHLKSLVDTFRKIRFVASGSAAAALRMKSRESGAGRFTDFMLPPLAFSEYLDLFVRDADKPSIGLLSDQYVEALNAHFVRYINHGGFPESAGNTMSPGDFATYVGRDIVDKVLLRDLPSLYGIGDVQGLNRLLTTLAYNTGQEVSLEVLSNSSGIAKNTIRRHLDYLEAAFLIARVHRIDENARHFTRRATFKVYLTNPSIYSALFGEVSPDDEATMGRLTETAYIAQLLHLDILDDIHYARWPKGEIDFVVLDRGTQKPIAVTEIKWSNRPLEHLGELFPLLEFCRNKKLESCTVTTRTKTKSFQWEETKVYFLASSMVCLSAGSAAIDLRTRTIRHALATMNEMAVEASQGTWINMPPPT